MQIIHVLLSVELINANHSCTFKRRNNYLTVIVQLERIDPKDFVPHLPALWMTDIKKLDGLIYHSILIHNYSKCGKHHQNEGQIKVKCFSNFIFFLCLLQYVETTYKTCKKHQILVKVINGGDRKSTPVGEFRLAKNYVLFQYASKFK